MFSGQNYTIKPSNSYLMINKEVKLDSLCLLAVNETTDQPSLPISLKSGSNTLYKESYIFSTANNVILIQKKIILLVAQLQTLQNPHASLVWLRYTRKEEELTQKYRFLADIPKNDSTTIHEVFLPEHSKNIKIGCLSDIQEYNTKSGANMKEQLELHP